MHRIFTSYCGIVGNAHSTFVVIFYHGYDTSNAGPMLRQSKCIFFPGHDIDVQ